MDGKIIIISAPSGAGKSTIVKWLIKKHPNLNLSFSVSCTTRQPRGREENGKDYIFLSINEFKEKIKNKEFLEYEEVYENRYYGTLKAQVDLLVKKGKNVILDVDVKGALNIKKIYKEQSISLFIQPPTLQELRRRLEQRKTDTKESIETRLLKAEYEITYAKEFDYIVINDDLEEAQLKAYNYIADFCKIVDKK